MRCIPTTYDAGHRHNVCFNGLGAFSAEAMKATYHGTVYEARFRAPDSQYYPGGATQVLYRGPSLAGAMKAAAARRAVHAVPTEPTPKGSSVGVIKFNPPGLGALGASLASVTVCYNVMLESGWSSDNHACPWFFPSGATQSSTFLGRRGFGQDANIPAIPKPPLPGYVTEEDHQTALAAQKAAIDKDMKSKHLMLGVGGLVAGLVVGFVVGKR